jgi:hypothetical protein
MAGGEIYRTMNPLLGRTAPVPAKWLLIFQGTRTPMCDDHKTATEKRFQKLEWKYGKQGYEHQFLKLDVQMELSDVPSSKRLR